MAPRASASSLHAWLNSVACLLLAATFLVGTPETVRAPRALSASSVYDSVFKGVDDGSITSYKLADLAVTRNKIAEGAVGRDQLAPGAVSALSLATGSVESGTLANGAVTTSHLQESSVTSRVLAESAVTRRAIARGAVGHEELGDGAVDGTNLADGSVTAAKLAAGAWLSNQAALGTVIWGEVHANGTAAVDGQYAAAALPDKGAGAYELRFARPFTRPPVVHVQCREPGLTEQPGLDGVMSVSFSNQKGTDMPSGFTFIAMETAPGTTS